MNGQETTIRLEDIVFPIFNIRNIDKYWEEDKILYAKTIYGTYILDNKNLKGKSLGERRLRITEKLYKFGKVIETYSDLIAEKHVSRLFIDGNGNLFKYKKNNVRPVRYFKVKAVHNTDKGHLLELYGTSIPFLLKGREIPKYVGLILLSNNSRLLFELSDTPKEGKVVWV